MVSLLFKMMPDLTGRIFEVKTIEANKKKIPFALVPLHSNRKLVRQLKDYKEIGTFSLRFFEEKSLKKEIAFYILMFFKLGKLNGDSIGYQLPKIVPKSHRPLMEDNVTFYRIGDRFAGSQIKNQNLYKY